MIINAKVVNPAFPDEQMKFRGQTIDSSVFSGEVEQYDFTGAKFTGNLMAVHFKNCNFRDADFTEANMKRSVKVSYSGYKNQFKDELHKPKVTDEQSKILGFNERESKCIQL